MSGRQRVPMRPARSGWIRDADVSISTEPQAIGRRFNMDVNEVVLAQMGKHALEAAVEQLGQHVAYEHQHEIHTLVATALLDKAWALPIIEDEMRRCVRELLWPARTCQEQSQ